MIDDQVFDEFRDWLVQSVRLNYGEVWPDDEDGFWGAFRDVVGRAGPTHRITVEALRAATAIARRKPRSGGKIGTPSLAEFDGALAEGLQEHWRAVAMKQPPGPMPKVEPSDRDREREGDIEAAQIRWVNMSEPQRDAWRNAIPDDMPATRNRPPALRDMFAIGLLAGRLAMLRRGEIAELVPPPPGKVRKLGKGWAAGGQGDGAKAGTAPLNVKFNRQPPSRVVAEPSTGQAFAEWVENGVVVFRMRYDDTPEVETPGTQAGESDRAAGGEGIEPKPPPEWRGRLAA